MSATPKVLKCSDVIHDDLNGIQAFHWWPNTLYSRSLSMSPWMTLKFVYSKTSLLHMRTPLGSRKVSLFLRLLSILLYVAETTGSVLHYTPKKKKISYMPCLSKHDIFSHFLHISGRGYRAEFHESEWNNCVENLLYPTDFLHVKVYL